MPSSAAYHIPVMLRESVEALAIRPDGVYADLTFGGGGHSMAILERIKGGRLIAFDQDEEAAVAARRIMSNSFLFIQANFRYFDRFLKINRITALDGIMADLGVSSHQIDTPERGFSTRFTGKLDMRMGREAGRTAASVLARYTAEDLQRMLSEYGEVNNARTLARLLAERARTAPLKTTADLIEVLRPLATRGRENKYYAKVFQALRMEVNDELEALRDMLKLSAALLKPGGRLVVIAYHSIEDRQVKKFMNTGRFEGDVEKDVYGNPIRPFRPLWSKPLTAGEEELAANPRSRSARLRAAEKI
jgi:16S rRNA (cytosine1402-N4)-methyltransferase